MNQPTDQPDPDRSLDSAEGPRATSSAQPGQPTQHDDPASAWFDGEAAATQPAARPRSTRSWITAGVVAVAIAAGSVFGINAVSSHSASSSAQTMQAGGAGRGGAGMGTQGTITAINGSAITVRTSSGSTKVTTTSSTAVSVAKTGTVADIVAGDHVIVIGSTSGAKVTATQIVDRGKTSTTTTGQPAAGGAPRGGGVLPPGGGGPQSGSAGRPTDGTVTKVDGSTLTVKGADGTTSTVSTGSTTKVTVESTASLSDLAAGDAVQVMGQTGTSGAVTATRIVGGTTVQPRR